MTQEDNAKHDASDADAAPPDSTRRLHGGLVGFGRMGLTHFAILNTHPRVSFDAICDDSAFVRHSIERYMKAATFGDYRTMIANTKLDFVIVATPTGMHAEVVAHALNQGLHVFVEKPLALRPAQSQELVAAAGHQAVVNQVGYVIRFNDVMRQVKRMLDGGALGDLIHYKLEMYGPTVLREPTSWRGRKAEGGGCVYDFASHSIDLSNYLFGSDATPRGTVAQRIYSRDVEDAIYTNLVYPGSLRGSLLVNWSDPAYRTPSYRLEVLGSDGKIIADLHSYKVFFHGTPSLAGFQTGWNTRYVTDFAEPVRYYLRGNEFTRQLDYFVDCILARKPAAMCTFADGLATDRLLDSILSDAANGAAGHG